MPLDPRHGVVGIAIQLNGWGEWWTRTFPAVYFVKLDEEENPEKPRQLIASTHYSVHRQDYIYLFNAPPGRYAAVAYYWEARDARDVPSINASKNKIFLSLLLAAMEQANDERKNTALLFSRNLISNTEVTIGPGTVGFMGTYEIDVAKATIDRAADVYKLDDLQVQIYTLLNALPGIVHFKGHIAPFSGWVKSWYKPRAWEGKRDRQDEEEFLLNTSSDLQAAGGSAWSAVIKKRIDILQGRQ